MKAAVSVVSIAVLFCMSIGPIQSVSAQEEVRVRPVDVYVSGFGGYSFPFKTDFSFEGLTASDVELKNSPTFGGKIGLWITAPRRAVGIDIGFEFDVTHFSPDVKIPNTFELGATYFGINALARVPMGVTQDLPNGRWFPYLGLGGGGQHLSIKVPGDKGTNVAPAFQGLGGIKVFVTRHIAVFAEGKFIHASHNQDVEGASTPLELDLNSVHGTGGLSVHF